MTIKDADELLPTRPGEKSIKKEIKGTPFSVYINGNMVVMSKSEALGVMAQINNILIYLDQQENE